MKTNPTARRAERQPNPKLAANVRRDSATRASFGLELSTSDPETQLPLGHRLPPPGPREFGRLRW